jgi:hypothetical protein
LPSSVGAARRTSDLRRPRRPQPAQHPHDRRSGRADRLGRGARRRPRPRLGAAPQCCRSRRRGARHRRASVGRMGSRRLLGRRALSQAACRSSSGLSRSGSESRDRPTLAAVICISRTRMGFNTTRSWRRETPPKRCSFTFPQGSWRMTSFLTLINWLPFSSRGTTLV